MGGQDVCQASEVSGVWVPAPEQDKKKAFITWTDVVSNAETFPVASPTPICPHEEWFCEGCSSR